MDMGPIRAERDKLEERARAAESKAESLLSVNAVLRTQLAEATDEAATLRRELAEARAAGEERATWTIDGDTRRLVMRRIVEERVGVVISDAHGGATWSVDANGHSASGHCPPGQVPEQAAERAQANVEAVAGVRP